MKFSFTPILICFIISCQDEKVSTIPPCLQEKIKTFTKEAHAQAIFRINQPDDPLYWFVEDEADDFEIVMNEQCAIICITDCECITEHLCEPLIFNYPMESIWEK